MAKKKKKVMRTLDGRLVRLCEICQGPYASVSGTTTQCLTCRRRRPCFVPHDSLHHAETKTDEKEKNGEAVTATATATADGTITTASSAASASLASFDAAKQEMKEKRGLDLQHMFMGDKTRTMGSTTSKAPPPYCSSLSVVKDEIVDVPDESTDTEPETPPPPSHHKKKKKKKTSPSCSFRPTWKISPPQVEPIIQEEDNKDKDDKHEVKEKVLESMHPATSVPPEEQKLPCRKRLQIDAAVPAGPTRDQEEETTSMEKQSKRPRTVTPDASLPEDSKMPFMAAAATAMAAVEKDKKEDEVEEEGDEEESSPDLEDCCFICGTIFSCGSSKGGAARARILHLKKCAKEYGVTLHQVSKFSHGDNNNNDDDDDDDSVIDLTDKDPFHDDWQGWHQDAPAEAAAMEVPGEADARQDREAESAPKSSKQSVMTNFFAAPQQSINSVLLASARNASRAKKNQALPQAEMSKQQNVAATMGFTRGGRGRRRGRFHGPKRPPGSCPSFKQIPGTDFICDGFYYATAMLSTNYFLTHFHSDHYGGITSQWNAGTIYCSLPTAHLVHQQLKVDRKYLHPLPLLTPTVMKSKDSSGKTVSVTVTVLDANHCPGAVMFLFQVGSSSNNRNHHRTILHVGDFRWNRASMLGDACPPLQALVDAASQNQCRPCPCRLDQVFLDTTYAHPQYAGMPTQEEAIQATIQVAQREMRECRRLGIHPLLLFGSYTIGKERLYLQVAHELQLRIFVQPGKFRLLATLDLPPEQKKWLTTQKEEASLWVVPLGAINFRELRKLGQGGGNNKVFSKKFGRVVGFQPTGWSYSAKRKGGGPTSDASSNLLTFRSSGMYRIYGVPYSEHSSFTELVDCLRCLKPKKIVPTVSVSSSDEQVHVLLEAVREAREQEEQRECRLKEEAAP